MKRAFTSPSVPTTKVAGIGSSQVSVPCERDTSQPARGHELLHLLADPEGEIEGERIAVVEIGQDRKRRLRFGLKLGGEVLAVGHDGGDLAAFGGDLVLRLGQSARVDAAIGAPMAAMEGDGDGSFLQAGCRG